MQEAPVGIFQDGALDELAVAMAVARVGILCTGSDRGREGSSRWQKIKVRVRIVWLRWGQ